MGLVLIAQTFQGILCWNFLLWFVGWSLCGDGETKRDRSGTHESRIVFQICETKRVVRQRGLIGSILIRISLTWSDMRMHKNLMLQFVEARSLPFRHSLLCTPLIWCHNYRTILNEVNGTVYSLVTVCCRNDDIQIKYEWSELILYLNWPGVVKLQLTFKCHAGISSDVLNYCNWFLNPNTQTTCTQPTTQSKVYSWPKWKNGHNQLNDWHWLIHVFTVNHLVRVCQPEARNFFTYEPSWAPKFFAPKFFGAKSIFQTFFLNFVKDSNVYVWNTTSQYTLLYTWVL